MLLAYQSLVLLLLSVTSCFASPLHQRQSNATSFASCAPEALQIEQFTTFTGNANLRPHVTFFLTNPNSGASGTMLCTATLGSDEGNFNTTSFYSCEQPGTGFNWQSGQLRIFSFQLCTNGVVNTSSQQIAIAAEGEIATTSYPGEYGGEYAESITSSTSIPIVDVQEVQSIDGGAGRMLNNKNVTCGFVAFNKVVSLGSCNLSDVGPPLML